MATFEEIFDAIEKERYLKREKREQFDKEKEGINREIDIATRFIYSNISRVNGMKKAKKFVQDYRIKEKIFNDFLEQVKLEKAILNFKHIFGFYEVECDEKYINTVLIDELQSELPSYQILINWCYDKQYIERIIGHEQGRIMTEGNVEKKGVILEVIARKYRCCSIKQKENVEEEKMPFVHIETFDDDIRQRLANAITYFLEHIPEYDEDVIKMLKEKELLSKYQPLIHGATGEKSQNLEIIIQLQYNIDEGVISEIKHYFRENDAVQLDREYEYYQENEKHYFKITREALEPLKKM